MTLTATSARASTPRAINFDWAPALVFWETTRACPLACRHCRAEASADPAPGELTTGEGVRLVHQLTGFGRPPVLVLTGGDVLCRPDLATLVSAARHAGLPVALAPSVSPRLDDACLERLLRLGVTSVSVSLDGATAATHEGVRGIQGHFDQTLDALGRLKALGFRAQVNTAVMRANVDELAGVAAIVSEVGAASWELFFLVHVGRGRHEDELSPAENEDVAHFLWEASRYGFVVRTVEGPWCRRVAAWRGGHEHGPAVAPVGRPRQATDDGPGPEAVARRFGLGPLYLRLSSGLVELLGPARNGPRMASSGTRDGKGILFVGYDGTLHPAGFLPVDLGNVRRQDPVHVYRRHPLLRSVRAAEFKGRCGRCEFRDSCGGSRARAFAASGDALAEDPACAYVPS
jgi:radical SAM protein